VSTSWSHGPLLTVPGPSLFNYSALLVDRGLLRRWEVLDVSGHMAWKGSAQFLWFSLLQLLLTLQVVQRAGVASPVVAGTLSRVFNIPGPMHTQ
jgi:hypothetical protein